MEWRIKHDGKIVAGGSAPTEDGVRREASRYAAQYALEGGSVEVYYRMERHWRKAATIVFKAA